VDVHRQTSAAGHPRFVPSCDDSPRQYNFARLVDYVCPQSNTRVHANGNTSQLAAARQLSLGSMLRAQGRRFGTALAIADGAMRVSFGELDMRTDRLASALADRGVRQGDRVATLLLDGLPAIELILANAKLGAITLTLNWRLAPAELAYIVESAAPAWLFHSECFTQAAAKSEMSRAFAVPDRAHPAGPYEALVASGSGSLPHVDLCNDDPLFMLYTSGTTGNPKGCVQSHQSAVIGGLAFANRISLSPEDRLLCTSPLFHVGGLHHYFAALAAGAATVVAPRGVSHEDLLRLASSEGCTVGSMNDGLLAGLIEAQRRLRLPLRLRSITRGASLTPAAQIHAIREHLGARVIGGYGQSEANGFATFIDDSEMLEHPSAIGTPLPHMEMCILDHSGNPHPSATAGELGLRGPSVMLGYWNDAQATRDALGSGWLRTGDLVHRDDEGRFHFDGRTKELVKTGGENVYPREVEQVLMKHVDIVDAAVIGVPDPRWGEAVKACIVLRAGAQLDPREVGTLCREHIAGYKRPRYVEYVDTIPRDHLGKVQRQLLRDRPLHPDQAVD
jgi:fatty-acyl-CoA synthase